MIYTDLTERAMCLAYRAHAGQVDKTGVPYIFHPYHLAEQMTTEAAVCVALLHDVVEDSDVTIEDIAAAFPAEVTEAVQLLTHEEGVPYLDYIRALRTNPLARTVKCADLAHNSDESRLRDAVAKAPDTVAKRRAKYDAARVILLEETQEPPSKMYSKGDSL